jgi:hypothetical protein
MADDMRDRIAKAMLLEQQRQAMSRPSLPLDDYRAPADAPYREDMPGMIGRIERRLQGPMVGPEIDPRMAPPPQAMPGIAPTNDSAVFDPQVLPGMNDDTLGWWRA